MTSFFKNCGETGGMVYPNRPFLFYDNELKNILKKKQQSIPGQIYGISQEQFLTTIYEGLVEYFVTENSIEPLAIYEDQIVTSESRDCKIEITGDQNRFCIRKNNPYYVDGYEVVVELPFTGDEALWHSKTSIWSITYPTGEVLPRDSDGYGKIVMTFRLLRDAKSEIITKAIEANLELIRTYIHWSGIEVEEYNNSLRQLVEKAIDSRLETLKNKTCP